MVAWVLVAAIRLYRWMARRVRWSRRCLFAVSCSRHAERVARAEGAGAALRAIQARFAACRPGYTFEFHDAGESGGAGWQVRCVDGSVIDDADTSAVVRAEAAVCLSALSATLACARPTAAAAVVPAVAPPRG